MSNCPVCNDELDDGYCHDCEHDLYDTPEWFMQKARKRIAELEAENEKLNRQGQQVFVVAEQVKADNKRLRAVYEAAKTMDKTQITIALCAAQESDDED